VASDEQEPAASDEREPAEVRRLGRHPEESPGRRLEDYLDNGQLHLPPGMEIDREYLRQMGSDNFGDGAGPAAGHMLGSVGDTLWGKIGQAYEAVTGSPQPEPEELRAELLRDEPEDEPG
jgi:hypothetical protein